MIIVKKTRTASTNACGPTQFLKLCGDHSLRIMSPNVATRGPHSSRTLAMCSGAVKKSRSGAMWQSACSVAFRKSYWNQIYIYCVTLVRY